MTREPCDFCHGDGVASSLRTDADGAVNECEVPCPVCATEPTYEPTDGPDGEITRLRARVAELDAEVNRAYARCAETLALAMDQRDAARAWARRWKRAAKGAVKDERFYFTRCMALLEVVDCARDLRKAWARTNSSGALRRLYEALDALGSKGDE